MQRAGLIMMRVSAGLFAFLIAAVLAAGAGAQAVDPASPPAQVRELLKLLGEPAVRDWLNEESRKLPAAQGQSSAAERPSQLAAERLALARARLNRLGAVVPRLPEEARRGAALLGRELQNHNPLGIVVLILGFPLLGLGAEWAFRRGTRRARERAEHAPYDSVAHRLRATGVRFAFGLTSRCIRARLNRRFPRVRMAATFEADCACLSRGRGSLARGNPLGPAAARTAPPRR